MDRHDEHLQRRGDGHSHAHPSAHAHSHADASGAARLERAFVIGIAINAVFVVVEAFFGWRADSLALLADAGHNLGDVLGLALAWAGAFAGRLAPDARHTYGWKRASILAAFANSLLLLVAIGSLAWEAIGRLAAPAPIATATRDGGRRRSASSSTSRTALLFLRGRHGDLNVRGAFLHMAGDARSRPASSSPRAHRVARLDLARSGGEPRDRARHRARHVGPVSRTRCTSLRRRARSASTSTPCAASSRRCPASTCVQRPARLGHRHDRDRAHRAPRRCPAAIPTTLLRAPPPSACASAFAIGHVTLQAVTRAADDAVRRRGRRAAPAPRPAMRIRSPSRHP